MPKFGILISQDDYGWWKFTLILNHKPAMTSQPYETAGAAFKAACHEANIRGEYKG
jgi:hypothetical protein